MDKNLGSGIIVPLVVALIAVSFGSSQGLLITPIFHSETQTPDGSPLVTTITINNIGWIQAKNVTAIIKTPDALHFLNNSTWCPEGTIFSNQPNDQLEIKFEKMSTNIDCVVGIEKVKGNEIVSISVSGINSPGYQTTPEKAVKNQIQTLNLLNLLITACGIISGIFVSIATKSVIGEKVLNRLPLTISKKNTANQVGEKHTVKRSGRQTNLQASISHNTKQKPTDIRIVINERIGNLGISIPANTTGIFEDILNSDCVKEGDIYYFVVFSGSEKGSIKLEKISTDFISD